jgi:hypothetical protein
MRRASILRSTGYMFKKSLLSASIGAHPDIP